MTSGKYLTHFLTSVFARRGWQGLSEPPQGAASRDLSLPLEAWLFRFTQQGERCYSGMAGNESYDLEQPIVYIT